MRTDKIKAIVVDDEINNVELLINFLNKYCPNVNVLDYALSKDEALVKIKEQQPELLFLDIILGNDNVFEMLKELNIERYKIIFVTAFDEFAIKAFKYNAIDYIIKPIQIDELVDAVFKVQKDINSQLFLEQKQLNMFIETAGNPESKFDFIVVPSMNKIDFVKIKEIVYFESEGRYTTIYNLNGTKLVVSKNIGEYEKILDHNLFFRIHHRYIINIMHALNIDKAAGNYCNMANGKALPVAKRRQDKLLKFLRIK